MTTALKFITSWFQNSEPLHNKEELILPVFSHLPREAFIAACRVSKQWNAIAQTSPLYLEKALNCKVIDQTLWEIYADVEKMKLVFDDIQFGDITEIIQEIRKLREGMRKEFGERAEPQLTLMTIPRNLTFDRLWEIARNPKSGNPVDIDQIRQRIPLHLRSLTVIKGYALTSAIDLPETENLPSKAEKTNCSVSTLFDISAQSIMAALIAEEGKVPAVFNNDVLWASAREADPEFHQLPPTPVEFSYHNLGASLL